MLSKAHDRRRREEEEESFRLRAKAGGYTNLHVLWQERAWMNTAANDTWTFDQFLPEVRAQQPADKKVLLFVDNLACQVTEGYREFLEENGVLHFAGPKGATHLWQPVDQNIGAYYHSRMCEHYDDWMMSGSYKQYEGLGKRQKAAHRRALLMEWAGRTYDELEQMRIKQVEQGRPEDTIFYKAFLNTGCLLNADDGQDQELKVVSRLQAANRAVGKSFSIRSTEETRRDIDSSKEEVFVVDADAEVCDSDLDDGMETDKEDDVGEDLQLSREWDEEFAVLFDQEEKDDAPFSLPPEEYRIRHLPESLSQVQMGDDFMAGNCTGTERETGRAGALALPLAQLFAQRLAVANAQRPRP